LSHGRDARTALVGFTPKGSVLDFWLTRRWRHHVNGVVSRDVREARTASSKVFGF
jgi:hypothetical protein